MLCVATGVAMSDRSAAGRKAISLIVKNLGEMAEEVGFEPTVELPLRLISSQVPSTTQPPFRDSCSSKPCGFKDLASATATVEPRSAYQWVDSTGISPPTASAKRIRATGGPENPAHHPSPCAEPHSIRELSTAPNRAIRK